MITVSYSKNNEIISLIEVTGHALFAPKGQDIVCSAVSSIMIGGLNNLKRAAEYKIVIEEGHVLLDTFKKNDEHDSIVLETMFIQLMTIEDSYKNYIKIKRI